jgi:hypothetical protein
VKKTIQIDIRGIISRLVLSRDSYRKKGDELTPRFKIFNFQAALTCLENPGICLHTDDETFLVMDHIEAKVIKRDNSGVDIRIINPTSYDARISILAETSEQAKIPLPLNAFNKWLKVAVETGGKRIVSISLNGLVKVN